MELTAAVVDRRTAAYPDVQPLSAVEDEHLELLPEHLARGDVGWREAEWVVQWYYRRYLGTYPDADRRAAEAAYAENDDERVREALVAAADSGSTRAKLEHLTALSGVDVPVASAFLHYLDPDAYLAVGPREWGVLRDAGELDAPYPDPPDVREYERYLAASRRVAERVDRDLLSVYRTLWAVGAESG